MKLNAVTLISIEIFVILLMPTIEAFAWRKILNIEDCPDKKVKLSTESTPVSYSTTEQTTTGDLDKFTATTGEFKPEISTEKSTDVSEAITGPPISIADSSTITTELVTSAPITEASTNGQTASVAILSARSSTSFSPRIFSTSTSVSITEVPTTAEQRVTEPDCHDSSIFCAGFRRLCNSPRGCQRRRQSRSLLKLDDELACVWVRMQKQNPALKLALSECDSGFRHIGAAEGIFQGRMNKSPRRLRHLDCDVHRVVTSVFVALCPATCAECH